MQVLRGVRIRLSEPLQLQVLSTLVQMSQKGHGHEREAFHLALDALAPHLQRPSSQSLKVVGVLLWGDHMHASMLLSATH